MSTLRRLLTSVLLLLTSALSGLALSPVASAAEAKGTDAELTFYRDVLPILQANCQECHRPAGLNYGGMRAPMALISHADTRPWAKSIARQVASREMPPWDADARHHGVFRNERTLTGEEIDTVVRWVAAGAVAGDPADAPPPREFSSTGGWLLGEPGLVVTMPEPYFVADEVEDIYTAFSVDLTPEMLPQDVWVVAFQCKPDSDIIHHFNLHLLEPDENGELAPPPTLFEEGRIAPSRQSAGRYMGGVSSGSDANQYPPGYGFLLRKGSRITFDIHYHKEPGEGTGVRDQSSIGFKIVEGPLKDLSGGIPPLMHFTFAIPPNDPSFQIGPLAHTVQGDVDLIALMPHMHMRGKAATFEAFYPDGSNEVLLHVPQYDFNWQTVYYFKELKRIPRGTRVEYTAWYDNSSEKAARYGFDSSRTVRFGQPSTDEMMMGFLMSAKAHD